jgi:hypothetical protein
VSGRKGSGRGWKRCEARWFGEANVSVDDVDGDDGE